MKKPVLVTTKHRGVFFGYMENGAEETLPNNIRLTDVKNCIYWSSDIGGFLGLASKGPSDQCKIGERVKSLVLYDITSVTDVEPDAVEAWEAAKWKS